MAKKPARSLDQRLHGPGPKRILSLDGGGVRGILSAGILAEIERRLARRARVKTFRLSDYFDLIGGTSTGALLAAGLARGFSAAEAIELYKDIAPEVFDRQAAGIRRPRFSAERLNAALDRVFGDRELQSADFKTGLAIFAKRIDTGSAWVWTNNPRSKYFHSGGESLANKALLVRRLIQASAAAPTFFEEVRLNLAHSGVGAPGDGEGVFVDGAIAGLNNPSLQLLKVATQKSYGFEWQAHQERLMILSIGTGYWRPTVNPAELAKLPMSNLAPAAARAVLALQTMIHDTSLQAVETLQAMSQPPRPWRVNGEVEDMVGDQLTPFPILHYQRFDVRLEQAELQRLELTYTPQEIAQMMDLGTDDPATIARLQEVGLRAGQAYFREMRGESARDWEKQILPPRFDPPAFSDRSLRPPANRLAAMGRIFAKRKTD
jgi:predicted acylesterase/phospholipase RssA